MLKSKTTALFLGRFRANLFSREKVNEKSRRLRLRALASPKQNKRKTALFLGRFQPFHLGHLRVVRNLSKRYNKVIILIGTRQMIKGKNPFSFADRKKMIAAVLKKTKIKNFMVIGIADNKSDALWFRKLRSIVPKNSVMLSGNKEMLALFRRFDFPIKKVNIYRGISATKVRQKIVLHKNWKKYVDRIVAEYLYKNKLLKKVRKELKQANKLKTIK